METTNRKRRALFLCTGNYYRSRFCEELFNARAAARGLDWQALSRALHREPATLNAGPMSTFAVDYLRERGVRPAGHLRLPLEVIEFDFEVAHIVVAVHEHEHRPMVEAVWPQYGESVQYWHVADYDALAADVALGRLEQHVDDLVQRIESGRTLTDVA